MQLKFRTDLFIISLEITNTDNGKTYRSIHDSDAEIIVAILGCGKNGDIIEGGFECDGTFEHFKSLHISDDEERLSLEERLQ